jgi:2-hydroxychromene-2-carboxylate isomerase
VRSATTSPFTSIPDYPNDADELAGRVAALAAVEGWCPAFARAAYRAWFLENKDPGQVEHLSTILEGLGREPGKIIAAANSEEVRDRYAAETEVARALGIFGSPSFVYRNEVFWGDDRLEDAIDWCKAH